MIEFFGCGKENNSILKKSKKNLNDFLSLVTSATQLRAITTHTLESKLSELGNYSKAISRVVGSATDGLFFSLIASGLKRGSKIGVTSYSFHASASCILRAGFLPVFIDVDKYGLMDLDNLENIAKELDGLIVVQLFGDVVNEKKLLSICDKYNLKFIEDAAQRHKYSKGLLKSSLCISSVLSFDPTKIFSGIGSGGAVITSNTIIAEKISKLRYHGNRASEEGFNSQLSESSAWLITKKIEKYNEWHQKKKKISETYNKIISQHKNKLRSLVNKTNSKYHSLHKFVVIFENEFYRDYIEKKLIEDEIKTMVHYRYILPELSRFKNFNKISKFPKSHYLSRRSLSLPIHPFIESKEIIKIKNSLSFHISNL